jgi:hypothetical protein
LSGGPGQTSLPSANEGVPITNIEVEFDEIGAQGDRLDDIRRSVLSILGLRIGDSWNQLLADGAMAKLTTLPDVRTARYRLVRHVNPDGVEVVVRITLEVEREKKPAAGILVTGKLSAFPILYQDDRSMFRILLNGGIGVFTDSNPWFGSPETFTVRNPLVQNPEIGAHGRSCDVDRRLRRVWVGWNHADRPCCPV